MDIRKRLNYSPETPQSSGEHSYLYMPRYPTTPYVDPRETIYWNVSMASDTADSHAAFRDDLRHDMPPALPPRSAPGDGRVPPNMQNPENYYQDENNSPPKPNNKSWLPNWIARRGWWNSTPEGPPTPRPPTTTQPLNADTGNYDLRSPPVPSAPYNTPSNGTSARPKVPHGHVENSVYVRGQGLPTHDRYETSPMPTTTPVPILTSTERRQNGDRSATEVRQMPQQNHYQGVPPPTYHTRDVSTEVAM